MPMNQFTTALATALLLAGVGAWAAPPETTVQPLIETNLTVLGDTFSYPEGQAQLTAAIVTVPPGGKLPPHEHPVPVFAYMLQGELNVDYGSAGRRTYRKGAALVEAFQWAHDGHNGGRGTTRLLVVYASAVGIENSVPAELE
jgi:quercetin dioxygenase-like cupin family protein